MQGDQVPQPGDGGRVVQGRAGDDCGEGLGQVLFDPVPGLLQGGGGVRDEVLDEADLAWGARLGQTLRVVKGMGLDVTAGGVPDGRGELPEQELGDDVLAPHPNVGLGDQLGDTRQVAAARRG